LRSARGVQVPARRVIELAGLQRELAGDRRAQGAFGVRGAAPDAADARNAAAREKNGPLASGDNHERNFDGHRTRSAV
jgi:hypothetical protein